jgi:hypothetical protein
MLLLPYDRGYDRGIYAAAVATNCLVLIYSESLLLLLPYDRGYDRGIYARHICGSSCD